MPRGESLEGRRYKRGAARLTHQWAIKFDDATDAAVRKWAEEHGIERFVAARVLIGIGLDASKES